MAFRRYGVKEPRLSETKIAEMCYLYRRTGRPLNLVVNVLVSSPVEGSSPVRTR